MNKEENLVKQVRQVENNFKNGLRLIKETVVDDKILKGIENKNHLHILITDIWILYLFKHLEKVNVSERTEIQTFIY